MEMTTELQIVVIKWITIACCTIIIVATIWAILYIHQAKSTSTIPQKKKWIDQLPALISSAGVLGTFLGIAIGLSFFEPQHLEQSVPQLLEGLKTAFYTSLCGMAGSMILTRYVNVALDDNDYQAETEDKSTKEIVKAITLLQTKFAWMTEETTTKFMESVTGSMQQVAESMNQIKDDVEEMKGHLEEMKNSSSSGSSSMEDRLSQIGAICSTATASLTKIDNCIYEIEQKISKENGKD